MEDCHQLFVWGLGSLESTTCTELMEWKHAIVGRSVSADESSREQIPPSAPQDDSPTLVTDTTYAC
jgi:hypothetical protein